MIEFNLCIDSRITRLVSPVIDRCFAESGKIFSPKFPCSGESDQDLIESWEDSLKHDFLNDRKPLACLLSDPKFKHGYVEVAEKDVDHILRALTEVRLYLREHCLKEFTDEELEGGITSFSSKAEKSKSFYLSYLVLAQIQEGLIEHLSKNL